MRKTLAVIMTFAIAGSLLACGGSKASSSNGSEEKSASAVEASSVESESESGDSGVEIADDALVLNMANTTTISAKEAGKKFKELVEKESNGTITVNLFNDNQLGDDRVAVEGTQLGEISIAISSTSPVAAINHDFYAFDAPYLFDNVEEAYAALDGELGQSILDSLENKGLKGLGYWENGFQYLSNNRNEAVTPEQLKGLKLRCMENELYIATWQAWGANPTPMAFGEIFTGLQQGTIDGQTTTLSAIYNNHFMDAQKYLTCLKYCYLPYFMCMNLDLYNSLTDEQRDAIDKAAAESVKYQRELNQQHEQEMMEEYESKDDIVVVYPTDEEREALKKCVEDAGVYDLAMSKMEHPEYLSNFLENAD